MPLGEDAFAVSAMPVPASVVVSAGHWIDGPQPSSGVPLQLSSTLLAQISAAAGSCSPAQVASQSDPAPTPSDYRYADYADDALAVLDHLGVERAVLVGHSMGAHTAARLALTHPHRVAALVLGAPAHLGRPSADLGRWDLLADGLARGGPEGMLAALEPFDVPDKWAGSLRTVIVQRLGKHLHPGAVADALRATPRSAAFDGLDALKAIRVPTLVVGSRDEVDPDHPLAVAREYAQRIPGARFVVEARGEAPLTWRGGALSRTILDFLAT